MFSTCAFCIIITVHLHYDYAYILKLFQFFISPARPSNRFIWLYFVRLKQDIIYIKKNYIQRNFFYVLVVLCAINVKV